MVASCYRRMEDLDKAHKIYKKIYEEYPENMECLRFLVQICQELGNPYEEYNAQFLRLKRIQEAQEARFTDFNAGEGYFNQEQQNLKLRQEQAAQIEAQQKYQNYQAPTNRADERVLKQKDNTFNDDDDDWGGDAHEMLPD